MKRLCLCKQELLHNIMTCWLTGWKLHCLCAVLAVRVTWFTFFFVMSEIMIYATTFLIGKYMVYICAQRLQFPVPIAIKLELKILYLYIIVFSFAQ